MLRGLVPMLGALWGGLIAVPIVRRARRVGVRERLRAHRRSRGRELSGRVGPARLRSAFGRVSAPATALVARWTEHRGAKTTTATIARELPVTIDLLGVAVRAGATPYLAIETAARWSPPIVGERLSAVVVSCRLGAGLGDALDAVVAATPALRPLADALVASDRFGAPVGDALARLAIEERAALRRRAETRARTVPVRLLFPLVFLVLPAFGLLTVAPALLTGLAGT